MRRRAGAGRALLLMFSVALSGCVSRPPEALPTGVSYAGALAAPSTTRGAYQRLVLALAGAWASCDEARLTATLTEDVDFAYPARRFVGLDAVLVDFRAFCAVATERSFYFPRDAFYVDTQAGRVAAELQFRATIAGQRQVVNDVWIATVREGRIAIIKEYLDGRVKTLQAQGVLSFGEDAPFLTPWPPPAAPPMPHPKPGP